MVTRRRLLVVSILVLAVAQCVLWWVAAELTWSFRDLLASDEQVIAERTRIAVSEFAWLGVNIVGLVAYAVRGRGFGRWVLAGIQSANAVITLWIGLEQAFQTCGKSGFEWFLLSGLAVLTVLLLYVLWRRVDRLIPPAMGTPVHGPFARLKSVFPVGKGVAPLALIVVGIAVGAALTGLSWHLSIQGIQAHSGIARTALVERGTITILHLTLDSSPHEFTFDDIDYEPLPDVRLGDQVVVLTAESCGSGSPIAVQSQRGIWIDSIYGDGVKPFTPETWPLHELIRWLLLSVGVFVAALGVGSLFRWIG